MNCALLRLRREIDMKQGNRAALAVACVCGLLATASSQAATITATNSIPGIFDGFDFPPDTRTVSFSAGDLALAGAIDSILDVNITIDFMKCAGTLPASFPSATPADDVCSDLGAAAAGDIFFQLTNPSGTTIDLVQVGTYSNSEPGARVVVTFSDDPVNSGDPVPDPVGATFTGGTFQPVGLLSTFNPESVLGDWVLSIADDAAVDQLGFARFTLNIALADATGTQMPAPATALLLGLGLAGLAAWRTRRPG
jgi:hypothetical protein